MLDLLQSSGPVMEVRVQVLPGSQLLASADEQGNIAVKDLRMLGGSSQHAPWPRAIPAKALPAPTRSPGTAPPHTGNGNSWHPSGNCFCTPQSICIHALELCCSCCKLGFEVLSSKIVCYMGQAMCNKVFQRHPVLGVIVSVHSQEPAYSFCTPLL